MISDAKLDFWIKNNYNVLFTGRMGVGKSSLVIQAFNRHGLKWKYFSAATMDPWVDFIGVPKERNDEHGPYLDLVKPRDFRDDNVEALFYDEFNRCLAGDTKIPLANGTCVPIKDLVNKEYFYVYSFNKDTNKIVIAKGHSARKTIRNEKLLKITLDNGAFVKCTKDHPFLTSNCEYKKASELVINESLMPPCGKNHKIISIEEVEPEDTYDITVDDYHNFAIECGVFVHNSHKKVRNAVMELIQFKSINGKPYNNLKIIWAAINPEDDENEKYDVEPLDPAQKDRFHIHITLPYQPYAPYFRQKYGDEASTIAIQWWKELPDKVKNLVSPRRLDYVLDIFNKKGDIRDALPIGSNPSKLSLALQQIPIHKILNDLFVSNNMEESIVFLSDENNYSSSIDIITKNLKYSEFFIPLMSEEKISSLISDSNTKSSVLSVAKTTKDIKITNVIEDIIEANQNTALVEQLSKEFPTRRNLPAQSLELEKNVEVGSE